MMRRILRRFARPFLPPGYVGESMLGDLDREFEERRRLGQDPGMLWYARETWSLVIHQMWLRVMTWIRPGRNDGADGPNGGDTVDQWRRDARYALRRMSRHPGFALVTVLTMALGIGANVAIFSAVKTVLLDPLPYEDPESLVAVWEWNLPRDRRENVANPGNVRAWRERSETLESLSHAVALSQPLTLSGQGEPRETMVKLVGPEWFRLLGLEAELGRTFAHGAGDTEQQEVVLSHRFWREFFRSDPDVIGRSLTIDQETVVVVGVLGPEYVVFSQDADLWASFSLQGDQTNTGRFLQVVGRLGEDASVEQAQAEIRTIAEGLRAEYPDFNAGWSAHVVPLRRQVVGEAGPALWILFGAVGLLLLIACVNVANLFLASATGRQREMAVRTSMGASGRRLTGQLLVESLMVAVAGGVAGVVLAWLGTGLLTRAVPDAFSLPRIENAGVDLSVLLFATGLTVVTGLLFGLIPALHARRVAPAATLNAEERGPGRGTGRLRNGLVVLEMALSVVLLVGAGLLARSFISLTSVDPGLEPDGVLTAHITPTGPAYDQEDATIRFFREYQERLARTPGVEEAGGITFLPMAGLGSATSFRAMDRPAPPREDWPVADIRNVIGEYFSAMGIRLQRGRVFQEGDREDAPPVAVVNEALGRDLWGDDDPVGKRIGINWDGLEEVEIIGVVQDVLLSGFDSEPRPTVYLHYPQKPYFTSLNMVVRSTLPKTRVLGAMERELHDLDPALALSEGRTMEGIASKSVARPRLTATLMGVFALLAAALAAVGLYGVLAYAVSRRVREIGLRIAIGAGPGEVVGLVLRQGLLLCGAGLLVGLGGALAGGRILESVLFGVPPTDPVSLAAAAIFLLIVALLATGLPAWRASRVAPMEALRAD